MQAQIPSFPAGWKVFPCHANSKQPIFEGWPSLATDNPDVIKQWATDNPGCNWAVACGPSNLAVLDIDPPIGEDSLFAFELAEGFLPPTREHRSARGGRHLIFSGQIVNSVGKLGPKLDTRGGNGYIIIPPSSFEGGSYDVTHDRPIACLPECVGVALGRLREAAKAAAGTELDTDTARARARRLLQDYVERDDIARQGEGGDARTYALCAEVLNLGLTPETAFDLINEIWNCACEPSWDEDELRVKIENASQYAQNDPGAWAVPPVQERIASDALDKLFADSAAPSPARGERSRFAWMDETEFMNMEPPAWLLKDILTRESIAMLYGPSGHYKSFIAMNLAASIAQAGECAFYVAAEGIARMARKDYPAWKIAYGEDRTLPFYMVEDMPIASDESGQDYIDFANSIRAKAGGRPVGVVFIDTLNRAMVGLEENSAKDASVMLNCCLMLKRALNCTVVVVHHTPADGKDPRGSSAFYAGFDTVLKVEADKRVKLANLWVKKQKTDEERAFPFCYEGRKIGPGMAFTPIEPREAAAMSADADIYSAKSISAALVKLKAFEPNHVSSKVLVMELVPQPENETEDQRNTSIARALKGLHGAVKGGKLDGYYEGVGQTIKWSLPAPA